MAAYIPIAKARGITPLFDKISDHWLQKYFSKKAEILKTALETNELPPICTPRERWNDRKCLDYCAARENCPYARRLIAEKEEKVNGDDTEAQAG